MTERLQMMEAEEAARALDRVDRPEHLREELGIRGVDLESDETEVELIEVLPTLFEESEDDFLVTVVHRGGSVWASSLATSY
jgi:hypothetical protein